MIQQKISKRNGPCRYFDQSLLEFAFSFAFMSVSFIISEDPESDDPEDNEDTEQDEEEENGKT